MAEPKTTPTSGSQDPTYVDYLAARSARAEKIAERDRIMARCAHWGHKPGEWKYFCCACSGAPGGCDNCSSLLLEEMGL